MCERMRRADNEFSNRFFSSPSRFFSLSHSMSRVHGMTSCVCVCGGRRVVAK